MSTILKALEKLEREKEGPRAIGPIPVLSASGSAKGGAAGWFLKPWVLWGLVGLIIVVLSGTAWHFYRQSRVYAPQLAGRSDSMDRHPAHRPADTQRRTAPARTPARDKPEPPQADRLTADRQQEDVQSPPGAILDQGSSSPSALLSSSSTSEPPPAREEKSAVRKPAPTAGAVGHSNSAIQYATPESAPAVEAPAAMEKSEKAAAAPAKSPVQPDSASERNASADVYANTPLLTDGRLRVHAIAWAPQPVERMTVVNNNVLHEGDSVGAFTVMVIRPDDVVVREKGKGVWRVEFGRP